jgi:hypothetical protein
MTDTHPLDTAIELCLRDFSHWPANDNLGVLANIEFSRGQARAIATSGQDLSPLCAAINTASTAENPAMRGAAQLMLQWAVLPYAPPDYYPRIQPAILAGTQETAEEIIQEIAGSNAARYQIPTDAREVLSFDLESITRLAIWRGSKNQIATEAIMANDPSLDPEDVSTAAYYAGLLNGAVAFHADIQPIIGVLGEVMTIQSGNDRDLIAQAKEAQTILGLVCTYRAADYPEEIARLLQQGLQHPHEEVQMIATQNQLILSENRPTTTAAAPTDRQSQHRAMRAPSQGCNGNSLRPARNTQKLNARSKGQQLG